MDAWFIYVSVHVCVHVLVLFPDNVCALGPKVLEGLALSTE